MRKLLFIFGLLVSILAGAQNYPMTQQNHNQTITTCSGVFTDDGGSNANYSSNISNRVITFCTDQQNVLLRFDFTQFNTESNFDELEIFNGPTATGEPAISYSGNIGSFVFISNQPGGCVTFRFNSDTSVENSGWVANISCVTPCTPPTAALASTENVEICSSASINPGDLTVEFDGSNSTSNDSFEITSYEWNWGDGTSSITDVPTTSHTFPDEPGIYTVTLRVRTNNTGSDPEGCLSSNIAIQLVYVLPPPNFEGTTEGPITISCGESVELTGIAGSQIITQDPPPNIGGEVILPDGSGISYYSYIDLTGYFPSEAVVTADCFPEIMMELEHSYAGDLNIDLIAPSGEEIRLFAGYGNFSESLFGWCVNNNDNQQPGCVAPYYIVNSGGLTWGESAGYTNNTESCDLWSNCWSGQYFLQEATFNSSESMNGLVGADLNGIWTLKITDNIGIDDGVSKSWSINFSGDCYTNLATDTPILSGGLWTDDGNGPTVPTNQNVSDITYMPTGIDECPGDADCSGNQLSNTITVGPFDNAGTFVYTFSTTDEYGCSFIKEVEVIVEGVETTFEELPEEFCEDSEVDPFPLTSSNGITGTWEPEVIDTSEPGVYTYTFHPSDSQCASLFEWEIEILPKTETNFTLTEEYCLGAEAEELPLTSLEGINGTWNPSTIDTSIIGTTTYEFTPDESFCASNYTLDVTITELISPEFTIQQTVCLGTEPFDLPLVSDNQIEGTWEPAVVDPSSPGIFTFIFTPEDGQCADIVPIEIEVVEGLELNQGNEITLCDDDFDGIYSYNLELLPSILVSDPSQVNFYYYASQTDLTNDNPIPNDQLDGYTFTILPNSIFVIGENLEGCRSAALEIPFMQGQEVIYNDSAIQTITFCPTETFDLTQFESSINSDSGTSFTYFESELNAQSGSNPIQNPDGYSSNNSVGIIYVKLEQEGSCPVILEIPFEERTTPSLDISPGESIIVCEGDPTTFEAISDDPTAEFIWTLPDGSEISGAIQTFTEYGEYSVIAMGGNLCNSEPRIITIHPPEDPVITNIEIGDTYILVMASNNGAGNLEFSLDGVFWQTSNKFENLIPGKEYTVYVRSQGCAITSYTLTVLSIPNFISPNGDGYNDVWDIRGIQSSPNATIKIFDRYGKIFVETNFTGNYTWEGKYLGYSVPSGDYWYIINVPADGVVKEQKFVGHISVRNQ